MIVVQAVCYVNFQLFVKISKSLKNGFAGHTKCFCGPQVVHHCFRVLSEELHFCHLSFQSYIFSHYPIFFTISEAFMNKNNYFRVEGNKTLRNIQSKVLIYWQYNWSRSNAIRHFLLNTTLNKSTVSVDSNVFCSCTGHKSNSLILLQFIMIHKLGIFFGQEFLFFNLNFILRLWQ